MANANGSTQRTYTHTALVSLLTQLDAKESKRERHANIYRLGHYLRAAQEMRDAVAAGQTPLSAFADTFTPTRGMHRIARTLGLGLDVERGQWIEAEEKSATWAEAYDATEQPVPARPCSQCRRDMGSEWILGPVCGKCCRANHARVTGQRVRTAHKATMRGIEG